MCVTFVTFVYIENDRLDRMACLHQFCSKLEEKYYRNFWSILSSFWRAGNGRNTSFWMVSHGINMNGYSRNSVITLQVTKCSGCPLARKTDENVDQAKELFREKQKNCYPWSWKHFGNSIWHSSENSERQSKHASDCCQICILSAEWGAEGASC